MAPELPELQTHAGLSPVLSHAALLPQPDTHVLLGEPARQNAAEPSAHGPLHVRFLPLPVDSHDAGAASHVEHPVCGVPSVPIVAPALQFVGRDPQAHVPAEPSHTHALVVPSHGASMPQPATHVPALQYPVAPEQFIEQVRSPGAPFAHWSAAAHVLQPVVAAAPPSVPTLAPSEHHDWMGLH